jgi:DNA-binding response OmpR family regulator
MHIRDLRLQGEDLRALPLPIDSPPVHEERLKVLVVEDNNTLLRLYRLRLESWKLPIDVVTAPNAIEGLLLVGRVSPDLLVTDLNMPGLDGMTMVRTISHSPFREGMEIVVVTGLSHEEIDDLGPLPAGVKIFQKPIPFQELKQICDELLRQRQNFGRHT